jgi:hypothetical protein
MTTESCVTVDVSPHKRVYSIEKSVGTSCVYSSFMCATQYIKKYERDVLQ